jgi:TonB family protein
MDRESKRLTKTRAAALLATVLLHAFIIIWALMLRPMTTPAIPPQAIQVVMVEKLARLRTGVELSPLQMTQLKAALMPVAAPDLNLPVQPPPPQAVAFEETAETNASVVASNGMPSVSSEGSGLAPNGEGDFTVAHRVQPMYSDASVRAREQGYVVVGLLIDERGAVRKAQVVQSSGFRRLDQSALDALRQWTFRRDAGASRDPTWMNFRYGFHLVSSNALDLSTVDLALFPYEPELEEQIRAAALPVAMTTQLKPRGGAALLRLIEAIQTAAPKVGRDFAGPQPPVQMVIKLGAVESIDFVNFERHGLEVDAVQQPPVSTRHIEKSQWELYRITQNGGKSEWLLEVTPKGMIGTAQALVCASASDQVTKCP